MRARNSGTRAGVHRQSRRLLVSAEFQEQVGAVFERGEQVEIGDAAARAVRDIAVDRQHDGRLVERVDQLRRRDADDAAMPAETADDQDVVGADRRIGFDRLLGLGDEIGFFGLALRFSSQSCCASARASSPIASSVARSSRAAMSGVLIRPAALTRGAIMKPT